MLSMYETKWLRFAELVPFLLVFCDVNFGGILGRLGEFTSLSATRQSEQLCCTAVSEKQKLEEEFGRVSSF